MINVCTQVVAGRTVALAFDTQAWLDMEDRFGSLADMAESQSKLSTRLDMLVILSRGGARKRPEASEIDRDWLISCVAPHELLELVGNANRNIADNMAGRETIKNDEPVDVVLEELNAKNAQS